MSTFYEFQEFMEYLAEVLFDTFRYTHSPTDIDEIVEVLTAAS